MAFSSPPPPPYTPHRRSETEPLVSDIRGHGRHKAWPQSAWICVWFLVFIAGAFAAGNVAQLFRVQALSDRISQYPPSEAELQAMKKRYEKVQQALETDLAVHARLQDYDKWAEDRLAHAREREWWLTAREQYRVDREEWEQLKTAHEDDASAWQKALQEHQAAQKRWVDEEQGWERERRDFQLEREKWAAERRAQEDRYRREAGSTLGVFWEHIDSHHCVGRGTREYTAVVGFDADSACQHMPITVNGAMFASPQECRRDGDVVTSRWNIDIGEASCKSYWGDLSDKGCVEWERRRFEARLLGLDHDMDGMNMCRSTPIDIREQHFDQPGNCEDKGWFGGISGSWDIVDTTCH